MCRQNVIQKLYLIDRKTWSGNILKEIDKMKKEINENIRN